MFPQRALTEQGILILPVSVGTARRFTESTGMSGVNHFNHGVLLVVGYLTADECTLQKQKRFLKMVKFCNRCNQEHSEIGVCPNCGCPEFRVKED